MALTLTKRRYARASHQGSTTIAADGSERISLPPAAKYTLFLYPTDGATVTVNLIGSSDAAVAAGTHNKQAWATGDITEDTVKVIDGPLTAIEIESADEACDVEVVTL